MKKFLAFPLLLLLWFQNGSAQELNARVQISAPKVSNLNNHTIEVLQTVIRDFLNNNKWTSESYLPQERIACNLVITIAAWDGSSTYQAEAQLQSSRPVYGTAYNSTLLNLSDKDFDFNYTEGQPVDFSTQNYLGNLSALLSYYAYTIIGLDRDSFSPLGGTSSFLSAQHILNLAQVSGNSGWKAYDGLRNRYWLNENLLNRNFENLRVFIYNYHRNVLDKLQQDQVGATRSLVDYLPDLKQLDKQKLGSIFPNMYFATKAEEMVNILSSGSPESKSAGALLLSEIDPANSYKYDVLKKN